MDAKLSHRRELRGPTRGSQLAEGVGEPQVRPEAGGTGGGLSNHRR